MHDSRHLLTPCEPRPYGSTASGIPPGNSEPCFIMAVIYLIRHSQASFGSDDYDNLSELGRRQTGILGAYLQRSLVPFDALLSGTLRRQQDTVAGIAEAFGAAAPEIGFSEAFNEYDHAGVVKAYLPRFMSEVGTRRGFEAASIFRDPRIFELAFRFMVKAWMDNVPHDDEALEGWRDFCARVSTGLDRILAAHKPKSRIAIVTSGGTIAATLRAVLGLSNKRTIAMNWSIYNASITQLYYGPSAKHEDALLLGFNNIAHLELSGRRELITFR